MQQEEKCKRKPQIKETQKEHKRNTKEPQKEP
jgi:hypothetical protein